MAIFPTEAFRCLPFLICILQLENNLSHSGSLFYSGVPVGLFSLKTHSFDSGKFYLYGHFLLIPHFFLIYFSRTLISEHISYSLVCNKSQQKLVAKNVTVIYYTHSICGKGVLTAPEQRGLVSALRRLGLGQRARFQGGSLTRPARWCRQPVPLRACPYDMAAGFPDSEWSKRPRWKQQCRWWPGLQSHICHSVCRPFYWKFPLFSNFQWFSCSNYSL